MTSIDNRISRHIREYDGQGWHRTGTTVDLESAHWLAGLVEEVGVEPVLESFTVDRVVPGESYIEVSGRRIEGLPLFDGGFTGAEGVHGQMGRHDAKIMLVEGSPILAAEALDDARRSGNYRALVFVTNRSSPTNCMVSPMRWLSWDQPSQSFSSRPSSMLIMGYSLAQRA